MQLKHRQLRTVVTRTGLMRAAEKLGAQHGVENLTVRAIIEEAGQKNESALQYHFKNRQGLIDEIHKYRFQQTVEKRRELVARLLAANPVPSLRELCRILVEPSFLLSASDVGYRQWIKAFGLQNASVKHPMVEEEQADSHSSILFVVNLLRERLPHLDDAMFENRYITVVRFTGLSMANHAGEKRAFRSPTAEFFINNLIDQLSGLFSAPVSEETNLAIESKKQLDR